MNITRLWNKIVRQICVEWIEGNGVLFLSIPFKNLNVCHQISQKCILKKPNLDWFANAQQIHKVFDFLVQDS